MSNANPLADKRVRSGIGLVSATTVAVIGVLVFDGPARWLVLGIAAMDALLTPYVLGLAADADQ